MGTGPSGASERINAGGESGSVRQSGDEDRAGQRAEGRSMGSSLREKGRICGWGEGTKEQGWAQGTLWGSEARVRIVRQRQTNPRPFPHTPS